jgi:hypothetical protein
MSGANELLKMLSGAPSVGAASKIRGLVPQAGQAKPASVENAEFAELLSRAQSGELRSGVPVTVDSDAGVSLSETDLAMLTLAADKAEAAGIRRAVVLTGDKALILDVQSRSVVGKADMKDGVLSGIDGVIRIGADGAAEEVSGTLPVPSGFVGANPSLASLLDARKSAKP